MALAGHHLTKSALERRGQQKEAALKTVNRLDRLQRPLSRLSDHILLLRLLAGRIIGRVSRTGSAEDNKDLAAESRQAWLNLFWIAIGTRNLNQFSL